MDQRNGAGRSVGPMATGWDTYRDDQLALLDHLEIEQCMLVGSCIGPSFIFNLIKAQPSRFRAAVLLQPIGLAYHTTEAEEWPGLNHFASQHWFGSWAQAILANQLAERWELSDLYKALFAGRTFVFTATRTEVANMSTPLIVFAGVDSNHPTQTARDIVNLAPHAILVEGWRMMPGLAEVETRVHDFLKAHVAPTVSSPGQNPKHSTSEPNQIVDSATPEEGSKVRIVGLQQRRDLNGRLGVVVGPFSGGRLRVHLGNAEYVRLTPEHLVDEGWEL
eukprot:CAMPEP_0119312456 /NCGR_PEP_ID=MMETSP1333-20130426/26516_1 /TAXON_ID=418940 /ORGANISM="Scyphosphaera apsteinii, Strain RCC1455" /LENGTH=276 /DNA_ID=CAMNT_0007317083 /DNA_START=240 /DNA_END=1070 /DNA_ORIENTATION=+